MAKQELIIDLDSDSDDGHDEEIIFDCPFCDILSRKLCRLVYHHLKKI